MRGLTLRYARNDQNVVRMTVVAGLKVSKRATKRNRVKRLIREAFRREYLRRIRVPADIVVSAKTELVGKSYSEVAAELGVALRKAGLITADYPVASFRRTASPDGRGA